MRKWIVAAGIVGLAFCSGSAVAHEEAEGDQTVTGEVVDMACYLDHNASGAGHQECAQKCISSGLPVGIKSADQLYLVIGSDHQPANKTLAPYAAKMVVAEGTVTEQNGVHLLALKKVTVK